MSRLKPVTPGEKKPAQILFCKNKYGPKVKVEHWDYRILAEKKDNHVYRDQLSNHVSTYNRMGTEDQGVNMTETRHMLAQIFTKTDPIYSFKPLVNFTSYPCTDTPGRNMLMKKANLPQLPPDFGVTDYLTTQQDDYRNPYPVVTKPIMMDNPHWLLNRVICSDRTQNYGTAPPKGFYQYLDTHTPIGHVRQLRLKKNQSFNPATCEPFPQLTERLDKDEIKPHNI